MAAAVSEEAQHETGESVQAAADVPPFEARFDAVASIVGDSMAKRIMPEAGFVSSLVYQLYLPNGNKLSFVEAMPGFATAFESGSAPFAVSHEQQLLSAADLYAELRPADPLPQELVGLEQRRQELAPIYRQLSDARELFPDLHMPKFDDSASEIDPTKLDAPRPNIEGDFGQTISHLTADECVAWCIPTPAQDWSITRKNKTSTDTISGNDVYTSNGAGCAHSGQVRYRVRYRAWWSWSTWFDHDLSAGQHLGRWGLRMKSILLDYDVQAMITDFQPGDLASHCVMAEL